MSKYQTYRGDPERKLVVTTDDFSGGINLIDSDDLMDSDNFRYGLNLDLDKVGDLDSRKGWGASGGIDDLFALIKDEPGFPVLGFDPLNQLDLVKSFTNLATLNTPDYADVKYFNNSKPTTIDLSVTGANRAGEYEARLVWINKIENPTEETFVSDAVPFTITSATTEVRLHITPFRDGQTGIDENQNNIYAALRVVKTSGGTGSVTINLESFVQGHVTNFRDTVSEIILFKLLHNPNNLWERIVDADSLSDVQKASRLTTPMGAKQYLQLMVLSEKDSEIAYFIASIEFDFYNNTVKVDKIYEGSTGKAYFNYNKAGPLFNTLMDIHYGYSRDNLFYNSGSVDPDETRIMNSFRFSHIGKSGSTGADQFSFELVNLGGDGAHNQAYKPSPLEIRRVGFNVLGDQPLTWIDSQGISSQSIQGVYLTTDDNIPIKFIPMGRPFKLHLMTTGTFENPFEVKFFEMVGEEKVEISAEIGAVTDQDGLYVFPVSFTTQPNTEVEIEIKNPQASQLGTYRDYYFMGQIDPRAKPVDGLDIAQYAIAEVWDRFVYFRADTLWYSDVGRFDYIPNLNYITLPLSRSDEITNITFFRNNYIIFTKEKIYKMVGHFESEDLTIDLVNDTLGCIAPATVQVLDNKLYFMSNQGLYALKSETFRQDLENVTKIDTKIGNDVIPKASYLFSYSTDDQYALILNETYTREKLGSFRDTLVTQNRTLQIPDVVRYYPDNESFIFDKYEVGHYPKFIANISGRILGWHGDKFYVKGKSHDDFGNPYKLYLETFANNFGFASHEKKYKQLMLKLGRQSEELDVKVGLFIDGEESHQDMKWASHLVDEIAHENSRFSLKRMRVPSLKGKNIAITLEAEVVAPVSLKAVSYTFKLGKMRE